MKTIMEKEIGLSRPSPSNSSSISDLFKVRMPGKQTPVPVPSYGRTSAQNPPKPTFAVQNPQSPKASAVANKSGQSPGTYPKITPNDSPRSSSKARLLSHPGIQKLQQTWAERNSASETGATASRSTDNPIVIDLSSSEQSRTPSPRPRAPTPGGPRFKLPPEVKLPAKPYLGPENPRKRLAEDDIYDRPSRKSPVQVVAGATKRDGSSSSDTSLVEDGLLSELQSITKAASGKADTNKSEQKSTFKATIKPIQRPARQAQPDLEHLRLLGNPGDPPSDGDDDTVSEPEPVESSFAIAYDAETAEVVSQMLEPKESTEDPSSSVPKEFLTALDGRSYNRWPTAQDPPYKGIIFPSGYELYHDENAPYICPIRTCRRLFPSLGGLRGHSAAAHRGCLFNDNLDGTMSIVGSITGKGFVSRVVSQIAKSPEPMPEPAMTEYVLRKAKMPISQKQRAKAYYDALFKDKERLKETFENIRARAASGQPVASDLGLDTTTEQAEGSSELATYIKRFLPAGFVLPRKGIFHELLQLPKKRSLPRLWLEKYGDKSRELSHATALLLYMVGDHNKKCGSCKIGRGSPFTLCITTPAGASEYIKQTYANTCAPCLFFSALRHSRNNCSFGKDTNDGNTPVATEPAVEEEEEEEDGQSSNDSSDSMPPLVKDVRSSRLIEQMMEMLRGQQSAASAPAPAPTAERLPEMEDWEIAPGRIRDEAAELPDNIAFSNAYLTSNESVTVADDVNFHVLILKPGHTHRLMRDRGRMRICSVASGKAQVKMGDQSFGLGPNGMFKLKPGIEAVVENRLYTDLSLHLTTLSTS